MRLTFGVVAFRSSMATRLPPSPFCTTNKMMSHELVVWIRNWSTVSWLNALWNGWLNHRRMKQSSNRELSYWSMKLIFDFQNSLTDVNDRKEGIGWNLNWSRIKKLESRMNLWLMNCSMKLPWPVLHHTTEVGRERRIDYRILRI
jgi:hypothetical protein